MVLGSLALMDPKAVREVIHQVNNLLAVIETQREVSRALRTEEAAVSALDLIGKAAEATRERIREFRAAELQ